MVFKTTAFDRSAIPPISRIAWGRQSVLPPHMGLGSVRSGSADFRLDSFRMLDESARNLELPERYGKIG